ncbi:condensation domain-containing protein, partial [Bacillus cereus group sp. BfR-BA-01511]|uniref:condensation domain-containing protein n=1 Tax=unclassified Bacillus cereus group TaxID=2750818 RepID=UPI001F5649B2
MNDQEKTNKAFINHPQLGRIYKTGDMGKMTPEGHIEFLGREDSQVKIKGYRVEIGEIENILVKASENVINATVLVKKDSNNNDVLCAFLVSSSNIDYENVYKYLNENLPKYMVPNQILQIEKLPLTENGKIDKSHLLSLDMNVWKDKGEKPRTIQEIQIKKIWEDILEIKEIDINENFFDLGGNSILIIKVINAIEKEFSHKISFKDFITKGTIKEIAKLIGKKNLLKKIDRDEIVIEKDLWNEPFKLTNVQMAYLTGRSTSFELGGTSTHAYLELRTKLDIYKLEKSIQHTVNRHPMLRTVFLDNGTQKVLTEVPNYKIEIKDITDQIEEEQAIFIGQERDKVSKRIMDPYTWPLFEFKAFKLSEGEYRVLFGIDMLIADGASIQMLFKEIADYYFNNKIKKPLDISFRDYVVHSEKKGEDYIADKEYWMNKLSDFPQPPNLPLKTEVSKVTKPTFKRLGHVINNEDWKVLSKKSALHKVTPAIVLFTLYAEVLSKWSNQSKLAINTTVFNRRPVHKEIDEVIGDFTSLLMLDIDFTETVDFWRRAKIVQENFMLALEHRQYDGVEFLRDYIKYNNLDPKAANMPVVFTSMLFGKTFNLGNIDDLGENVMAVSQTSQVYLDHQVTETASGINLTWDYVLELFDQKIIHQIFEDYISRIHSLVREDKSYETIEDHSIVIQYNNTQMQISNETLHSLFEKQAINIPNKIAVEEQFRSISYEELNDNANIIGAYLKDRGIVPGDYIAVLGERKIETICAILGILKIGAAYIPLAADIPKERKEKILAESNCKTIINAEVIADLLKIKESADLEPVNEPNSVAYAIYTSGSTGTPKGVVIKHQAAVNTILDINSKFDVTERDKVIGLSNLSFDLSVYD